MHRDAQGLLRFTHLSALPGAVHAFVPADAFGGYDARAADARGRVAAALHMDPERLQRTRQTHSACAGIVGKDGAVEAEPGPDGGVDALVTRESGVLLHAVSADCPLLYLVAPRQGAVALAHCGWRGVARGVIEETLVALRVASGARAVDVYAGISPGASGCCYEVGSDVLDAMREVGVPMDACTRPGRDDRAYFDLRQAIVLLLLDAGVAPERIEKAPDCSICGGTRYHSHRRDAERAGRMSGVLGLGDR